MTETATPSGLSTRDRTFWSVMALFLVSDIVTKRWAESSLQLHWPNEVVGHWLRWTLTYNTGAAMNLSLGGASRIVFSIIAVVMVGYLFALYRQARRDEWGTPLALGMIVAGAIGNLIDRLRHTKGVVDFIDVGTAGWRFWTFNVADIGVTVGAVLLAILLWREDRAARSVHAEPSHTSGTDQ